MTTTKARILDYLSRHPEGVDDDNLALALGLTYRQQANKHCRELEAAGLVRRVDVRGKIHNFLAEAGRVEAAAPALPVQDEERPWYWEGNVQDVVVGYLRDQGCQIWFAADTASRQAGKDIEAGRDGRPLWVTVKGYPKGTARTRHYTQARHWFKDALFDIVVWRGESGSAELGVALPDFPTYRNLSDKVTWFRQTASFTYYWVREDGTLTVDQPSLSSQGERSYADNS